MELVCMLKLKHYKCRVIECLVELAQYIRIRSFENVS